MKRTKIVATISDRKCDLEFLEKLYNAGMNVVRINTAHQTPESAAVVVEKIREVSDSIAVLIDTKGPEIRTKNVEVPIDVKRGDVVMIKGGDGDSSDNLFYVDYNMFVNDLSVGDSILIDDGELELTVTGKKEDALVTVVENDGQIKNRKSINVPGVSMTLPSITEKDRVFIEWAADNEVEFIAHSFVRNKEDVIAVQEILDKKKSEIKIIAKIENLDGVNNIDEILEYAYGVMVARGDLGIEIPYEKIPGIQRQLIRKCVERGKPVIIATQMLHSMISNPRPTRAEVSDVANAIFYRTDAIMLSGETAYGDYAVEAVEVMASVANEVENSKDHRNDLPVRKNEIALILAEAAVSAAKELDVKAIVTDTLSGRTARYLSAYRSNKTVFAKCHNSRVKRELALSYGVCADVIKVKKNKDKLVRNALCRLVTKGHLEKTDNVVYVGGGFGVGGGTTFMEIANVERMTLKDGEGDKGACKA
jgi:pyruvate kinase